MPDPAKKTQSTDSQWLNYMNPPDEGEPPAGDTPPPTPAVPALSPEDILRIDDQNRRIGTLEATISDIHKTIKTAPAGTTPALMQQLTSLTNEIKEMKRERAIETKANVLSEIRQAAPELFDEQTGMPMFSLDGSADDVRASAIAMQTVGRRYAGQALKRFEKEVGSFSSLRPAMPTEEELRAEDEELIRRSREGTREERGAAQMLRFQRRLATRR